MGSLNLTTRHIIVLLVFQGSHLNLRQDNASAGHLRFQILEAIPEIGQLVAQPDAADPTGRNKCFKLAQLIAGSGLAVSRIANGIAENRFFCDLIHPVLWIRFSPGLAE